MTKITYEDLLRIPPYMWTELGQEAKDNFKKQQLTINREISELTDDRIIKQKIVNFLYSPYVTPVLFSIMQSLIRDKQKKIIEYLSKKTLFDNLKDNEYYKKYIKKLILVAKKEKNTNNIIY